MRTRATGALEIAIPAEFWRDIQGDDMERLCATGILPPDQVARLCRFMGISPTPQGEVKIELREDELKDLLEDIGPPIEWKRTDAEPVVAAGVTFHCYRNEPRGRYPSSTDWRSEDGGLRVSRAERKTTFIACADERMLIDETGKWLRFQTMKAAMIAAVKARNLRTR